MSIETHCMPSDESERDEQLQAVIAEYIRGCEAGRPPVRQELLNQYPEFAAELKQFFAQRDQMNRLADPIRAFNDDLFQAVGPGRQLSYVGNYELLEEIARGGMGVVYKARQTTLGRIVAVKMIVSGQLANAQDIQRFQSEARAAASLKHANIVAIHEVGQHEGWHYFSMDYVEGHDLATILRINLLPASTAAAYVRQMAEAIHYAHQQGILHRDLKPSNILVDRTNQIHITDFGLAMRVEGDQGLTQTGQILGTPSYMPPEQAQCKRALIGPASDVYSLGAILYECLTGRPPYRAESVIKTIEQVIHADAASPRALNASVPRDLETICLKCLEKEPHRRYGTAQLLQEDLGRFLSGEPILARPARGLERTVKWIRRHPLPAALLVSSMVALLAMVGMGLGLYYNARLDSANGLLRSSNLQLEATKQTLESSNQQLSVTSAELARANQEVNAERTMARRHLYASRMALIQVAEQNGEVARIVQLLRSLIPESELQEDLRDFEWNYLWRKYYGEEFALAGHSDALSAVASSLDDKCFASGSIDGSIKIWDAETHENLLTLVGHVYPVQSIAFSKDRHLLISADTNGNLKVWDLTSGREIREIKESDLQKEMEAIIHLWEPFDARSKYYFESTMTDLSAPRYDFDKSRCVRVARSKGEGFATENTLQILDSKNNDRVVSSIVLPAPVAQIAFNFDGSLLAAAVWDHSVRVWQAQTGEPVCTFHAQENINCIAFSSEGKAIYAGTEGQLVMQWKIPKNQEHVFYRGRGIAPKVCFGSGGKLMAAVCGSKAMVWNLPTGELIWDAPVRTYTRIAMSPTQSWIAGAPPHRLIDVRSNDILAELDSLEDAGKTAGKSNNPMAGKAGGVLGCAFSPNELLVAHADGFEGVTVHRVHSGEQIFSASVQKWASCVAFSSDSKILAAGSGFFRGDLKRGSIAVWDIAVNRPIFEQQLPLDIWSVEFSPDGSLLAAAMGICEESGQNLGRIRIWRTDNWSTLYDLRASCGCVWSVSFNASGSRIVSAGGQQYRPKDYDPLSHKPMGGYTVWDVATGLELLSVSEPRNAIYGVAFSPDGTQLATACRDGTVNLWNGAPIAETQTYQPLPVD